MCCVHLSVHSVDLLPVTALHSQRIDRAVGGLRLRYPILEEQGWNSTVLTGDTLSQCNPFPIREQSNLGHLARPA